MISECSGIVCLKNGSCNEPLQNTEIALASLIIELDSNSTREELTAAFTELPLEKITFNGGIYMLYFSVGTSFSDIILVLGKNKVPITYIRDISTSTRRFFVN